MTADDFPDVRRALDALPLPPLPPVDVAAIYQDALAAQLRRARRWKRAAAAGAALAAGVVLFALLPRLDVRVNSQEFSVRWGSPPEPPAPVLVAPQPPPPDPRLAELVAEQKKVFAALRDGTARHAELQDLLLTLARDVRERDDAHKQQLADLVERLNQTATATAGKFQETDRTLTTLYHALFPDKPAKGDQP